MDEQASFEARAVLAPRRARLSRLALLVPVLTFVVIVWAGVSGARSDRVTAEISEPTAIAGPSAALRPELPTKVVGIDVQRLRDVQPWSLGRDEVVAVAGWYVATAITDCPSIPAIFRNGSLPELRGDADTWTFCERSGLLYAARPERDTYAGLSAVPTTIVIGVIAPIELEVIGAEATEVIVIGRFVESSEGCPFQGGCRPKLMVDHVAWTPGA